MVANQRACKFAKGLTASNLREASSSVKMPPAPMIGNLKSVNLEMKRMI